MHKRFQSKDRQGAHKTVKGHTRLKGGKFQNGSLKKKQNVGRELDSSGLGQGIEAKFCEYGNERP
jgi:hypothetical protein